MRYRLAWMLIVCALCTTVTLIYFAPVIALLWLLA